MQCDALLRELEFDDEEDAKRGLIAYVTGARGRRNAVLSFVNGWPTWDTELLLIVCLTGTTKSRYVPVACAGP